MDGWCFVSFVWILGFSNFRVLRFSGSRFLGFSNLGFSGSRFSDGPESRVLGFSCSIAMCDLKLFHNMESRRKMSPYVVELFFLAQRHLLSYSQCDECKCKATRAIPG